MARTKRVPDPKEDPKIIAITESMVETERPVCANFLVNMRQYFAIKTKNMNHNNCNNDPDDSTEDNCIFALR